MTHKQPGPPRARPKPRPRSTVTTLRPNKITLSELHARLDALADLGLQVSVCYGASGELGRMYSVDVLTSDLRSFPQPFAAKTFEKAIWIAEIEGPKLIR